ncbi:MAG TPA: nucleotidyltransferase family protein, partial [Actinomycetota bacterium]
MLDGSWRADPAPPEGEEPGALDAILPFLLASGSGALAWARIRTEPRLAETGAGHALHDAFRHSAIDGSVRERQIVEVVARLRSAGVEPMLVKGRAAAAAYAQPGLRPGGDIDLLLRPEDIEAGQSMMGEEIRLLQVDLKHEHLVPLADRAPLFARAGRLLLEGEAVCVPSPEDHLRLVCLHALAHGVARPVWLCDVAAWSEARAEELDWPLVLSEDAGTARRVRVALGLAHVLLGMRLEGTPIEDEGRPPSWAVSSVLRRWGDSRNAIPKPAWETPRRLHPRMRAVADRWPPDPVFEEFRHGRSFTRWPRLPFHVIDAARR